MHKRTCDVDGCDRKHIARGLCARHYQKQNPNRHRKVEVPCTICGVKVMRRPDKPYRPTCSVTCRTVLQFGPALAPRLEYDWGKDAVGRARKLGAPVVEEFDREEIFERDNWTCYLCGIRCNEPSPFDLQSATVDHVVSLWGGGEHSRANARTACLLCNSTKQARLVAA